MAGLERTAPGRLSDSAEGRKGDGPSASCLFFVELDAAVSPESERRNAWRRRCVALGGVAGCAAFASPLEQQLGDPATDPRGTTKE